MQARTRGIDTHLRVGKRQRKREEPRRGGGAHIVGRHLMWEASAEAWWWTPQVAAPRAKAPVQVQTSTAGRSAGSQCRRRGAGMRSLLPHRHPTRGRRGRSAPRGGRGETRGGGDGREMPVAPPPQSKRIWIFVFFNPIESNPKLSKANGYPYPTKSKST